MTMSLANRFPTRFSGVIIDTSGLRVGAGNRPFVLPDARFRRLVGNGRMTRAIWKFGGAPGSPRGHLQLSGARSINLMPLPSGASPFKIGGSPGSASAIAIFSVMLCEGLRRAGASHAVSPKRERAVILPGFAGAAGTARATGTGLFLDRRSAPRG